MHSAALRQSRRLLVYTPPGYDAPDNEARYPVLYLLHGCPDPGDGWNRYGRAAEEVDQLCVQEDFPPMIVVCPDGNGLGSFGDSEYIDAVNPKLKGKAGVRVATYLTDEAVPFIDQKYRTIPTPAGRLIGGISTGGYGAVNLGLRRPDLFSTLFPRRRQRMGASGLGEVPDCRRTARTESFGLSDSRPGEMAADVCRPRRRKE
jgi:enterochelin esterase-like enzyme